MATRGFKIRTYCKYRITAPNKKLETYIRQAILDTLKGVFVLSKYPVAILSRKII